VFVPGRLQAKTKTSEDPRLRFIVRTPLTTHFLIPAMRPIALLTSVRFFSEEKIDDIARKIDRIYLAVDNIGATPSSSSRPTIATLQASSSYTPTSTESTTQYAGDEAGSEFEGELSLNTHAAYATDYVQHAINGNNHISNDMISSLDALRQVVGGSTKAGSPGDSLQPPQIIKTRTTNEGFSLPPMPLAMSCLQRLRGKLKIQEGTEPLPKSES
jgi:hypothetical protein